MTTINLRRLALAGVLAGALSATAGVQAQLANRFTPFDQAQITGPVSLPPGLGSEEVTVVVYLSGDAVASVQASLGHKLSKSVKANVKAQRVRDQDAVKPRIEARGGKVVGSF